ncbi:MAG: CCA tRNA nucleotidyltransferase [Lachnospiraceae bacterium]|nr:CCA tRNA nucleotidyltransferase [Lachnospiraceae bacterium]MBP5252729.1 CCA tRNA nucleotidyltransferase [Lachnospiraceae bacterium]MBP5471251.1 CCA tRNA nucleotidyltransferase [Lachnospiraceae bacterium]MBP5701383.1 CCA tRNA nucleotidyltransferase [Lachnospiraceae bacterium]MBP5762674.1 CCA tRNA nucleotidyltransferase [Lachnospiraceae bacterium]
MEIRIPKDAKSIIDKLTGAGYEAYIVGGCVRDCLLGLVPDDWDITTNALPEQVKELFRRTIDTGIEHGTVTVMIGDEGYEVTTYRTDGAYSDGRHPDKVTFVPSLEEDLKRRDFTINAMAYNDSEGLVDLFGGRDDIEKKIIRCVGCADERFSEDALRMMRAVRFAAKLGYGIDDEALASIKKLAPTLSKVSAERITTELTKLLVSDHPEMIETLYETGLTKVFFPEFDKAFETPQVHPHHCFNVGKHITESVRLSKNDRIVRFAMLLHDIGKPETLSVDEKGITHFHGHPSVGAKMGEEIMRRWKLDNDTIFRVCRLIKHHDMGKGKGCTPALTRKAVSVMEEDFLRLLDVMKADVLAQSDFLREQKLENIEKYGREYERIVKEGECCSLKELAVGGRDLIDAGIAPGPVMGEILGKLLERVLEDPSLNERDTLLLLAKEYI